MNKKLERTLYWTPRVLTILFILFLSLFALDVFSEEYTLIETTIALFMHLIPSLLLAALLILSWKKEKLGGILFLILGVVFTIFFGTYKDLIVFIIISMPIFLIGIMFVLHDKLVKK